jgi:hypothetical protein
MEGLEDRLSQPVAFATVPLNDKNTASTSSSSDTDLEDLASTRGSKAGMCTQLALRFVILKVCS